LRSSLRQATYTYVPLSPSSILWYLPRGESRAWWKVMAACHQVYD